MKNTTRQTQQMRADVDRLVREQPSFVEKVVILRDGGMSMKIRLRKLHFGEKRRTGDLWLEPGDGMLHVLNVRWWQFAGRVDEGMCDHYRIAP